jgi:hypothetical protein
MTLSLPTRRPSSGLSEGPQIGFRLSETGKRA